MTLDKFFAYCEKNDPQTGIEIANQLIDTFIMMNPDRKDMSRADWLSIAMNTYQIFEDEAGITLEPIEKFGDEKEVFIY
jgi:hypothetical protein